MDSYKFQKECKKWLLSYYKKKNLSIDLKIEDVYA